MTSYHAAEAPKQPQPLVSIVTNTYNRTSTLLKRLIPSIVLQEYPNIEHVIVHDGPIIGDEDPYDLIYDRYVELSDEQHVDMHTYTGPDFMLHELGRHSSSLVPDSFGVAPLMVGCWLAKGKYIICVPDDDIMAPSHIKSMVDYMEEVPQLGFCYTGFLHRSATTLPYVVLAPTPRAGAIASPMFKADLLAISGWQMHEGLHSDYKLVERWVEAGVEYGFIDDVTFEHFADH